MKEHKDACEKGLTERSAIAEHAWNEHHPIEWKAATIVDKAKGRIEGTRIEGSAAYPVDTEGAALQPRCWGRVASLLGWPPSEP